jgi:uncharacterized protein YkwD
MLRHLNSVVSSLFSVSKPPFAGFGPTFLGVLVFCGLGSAQNLQSGPVARLVSDVVSERSHAVPSFEGVSPASASLAPSMAEASVIERRAFDRTNEERAKAGLPPLVWDAELCRMARSHSESMATLGFFGHETPEGLQLKQRAHSMGIGHFRVIAENIAYNKGYEDPGAFAVERWMISSGHRSNILYVGFQASAIGSFVSKDGSVYLTQVFINR